MTIRVDFLQGADAMAPGLTRAQIPLLNALQTFPCLEMQAVRFRLSAPSLIFPFVYGPLPVWLALRGADIVHIANSWYAHLVSLLSSPTVVTCHDLIELEAIESGQSRVKPHRRFHAHAAFRGLTRARMIVCDSQSIADRIEDRSPKLASRVRVVPLGISSIFTPGDVDEGRLDILGARRPYLLYVGSEQSRKNVGRLVHAVAQVRRVVPNLHFVKVGSHQTLEGRRSVLAALESHDLIQHSTILDQISDADLVTLYRGACVTALVSLSEGFGFPPLEAMACGCPVIVSNRDSLPELVGPEAPAVDPLDIASMADAIAHIIRDTESRDRLRSQGLQRAATYTWQRTAEQYRAIYAEAVEH